MIDIKSKTASLLQKKYLIPEEVAFILFNDGILQEHNCKKLLIIEEYESRVDIAGKQMLKIQIADKYCVSLASVEKYIAEAKEAVM